MMEKQRRGRPPNSLRRATRDADEVIARTVWQLLAWGYPLRRPKGVAETVGQLARTELSRTGHGQRDLGPDQVEKIFKAWLPAATYRSGWIKNGKRLELPVGRPWCMVQLESLVCRRPSTITGLEATALELIRNNGRWPESLPLPRKLGDAAYTVKHQARMKRPTMLFPKNGVIK
jgi:hypothetical protein